MPHYQNYNIHVNRSKMIRIFLYKVPGLELEKKWVHGTYTQNPKIK